MPEEKQPHEHAGSALEEESEGGQCRPPPGHHQVRRDITVPTPQGLMNSTNIHDQLPPRSTQPPYIGNKIKMHVETQNTTCDVVKIAERGGTLATSILGK